MISQVKNKTFRTRRVPARKRQNVRYNKNRRMTQIPTAPPQSQLVKLRYVEPVSFTSTLGSTASTVWRLNDLFDPYQTGVGHQSLFRDQTFALYRNARVLGTAIKVTICGASSVTSPLRVTMSPIESGTADATLSTASERKYAVSRIYNPGGDSMFMKTYISCDKYFGFRKGTTSHEWDFNQTSTASINSDRTMWWQLVASDITSSTNTIYCNVELEQIVIFQLPLQVTGS